MENGRNVNTRRDIGQENRMVLNIFVNVNVG